MLNQIRKLSAKFNGLDFFIGLVIFSRNQLARVALAVFLLFSLTIIKVRSQVQSEYVYLDRFIEASDLEIEHPAGLAYSSTDNVLIILENVPAALGNERRNRLVNVTLAGDLASSVDLAFSTPDGINVAYFTPKGKSPGEILILDRDNHELVELPTGPAGDIPSSGQGIFRYNVKPFGLEDPQGMAVDQAAGRLFLLDASGPSIIRLSDGIANFADSAAAVREGRVERIRLDALNNVRLRGIAYNPENDHLYVLGLDDQKIYELTGAGQIISVRDVSESGLKDPQGMVFAPSGDPTDDPGLLNLYIADGGSGSGGAVMEFSLTQPELTTVLLAANASASLVQTINTSAWSPSSPDPVGIDYNPRAGRLIVSDSEVDEMAIFQGKNVFESSPSGSLVTTCTTTTTGFSREPTGVAVNPENGHIFFSDDYKDEIFEINPGPDSIFCTSDDVRTSFDTGVLNNTDPEGIAYGQGKIFISDGDGKEVYVVSPGANGRFDGVSPAGDDQVTHFDVLGMGLRDPEGIGFHPQRGSLFIVSRNDKILVETTVDGAVLNIFDITFLNATGPSGVGYGPSSQNTGETNIYITDRGIDNNVDPNENDGKIYEISLSQTSPVPTPTSPPPPTGGSIYLSLANSGPTTIGGVSGVRDEDIVYYNGSAWSMFFDGSDVGTGGDLDAFYIMDADTILLSFTTSVTINSIGVVDNFDIVRFDATSLGANTAGSFSLFFDGNDVGFDTSGENIDGFDLLPDGRLIISTSGNPSVPGVSGRDEDMLAFTPSSLGATTAGTWAMYYDGSDVGLSTTSGEDIDAMNIAANGDIYLSTRDIFAVSGVSGSKEDVFICVPITLGDNTSCSFIPGLYFDGSAWGLGADNVDAIDLP